MPDPLPRLLLISTMRSGTNWCMDVAGRVPGILCFRDVFNPRGAFGLKTRKSLVADELAAHLGMRLIEERDPELIAFVRGDPDGFLCFAADNAAAAGIGWIGATLFPGHLRADQVFALLSAPNSHAVLLKRRHLDRAISLSKARWIGAWKHADTTDLRPELSMAELVEAMAESEAWFAEIGQMANRLSVRLPVLTYEDHVMGGADRLLRALAVALPGFPWAPGAPVPVPGIRRQDKGGDTFNRITNGAVLRTDLSQHGLLSPALGYPGGSIRSNSSERSVDVGTADGAGAPTGPAT